MNYQILRHIIEWLTKSYKCNDCWHNWASENNIEIVWLAWNTTTLDIVCPNCWKSSIIRAQMTQVNIWEQIWDIAKKIEELKNIPNQKQEEKKQIQDVEIVELKKTLKKENISVLDILEQKE